MSGRSLQRPLEFRFQDAGLTWLGAAIIVAALLALPTGASARKVGNPGPEGSIAKLAMAELNKSIYSFCMDLMGAEAILYPTAIGSEPHDTSLDTRDPWRRVMQGHAVANVIPVAAANRIGHEPGPGGGQSFYGSSFLADHRGDLVASLDRQEEGVLTATFDLDFLATHRAAWGFFRDRRPDLYGALTAPRPS